MRRWWTPDRIVGRGGRPATAELAVSGAMNAAPAQPPIDAVLERAGRRPPMSDEGQPAEPSLHLVVLACMDPRVDPAALLGLRHGEAHVIRNAGGIATPETLEALRLSRTALGTREVMVIHHTGCAALAGLGRRDPAASVRKEVGRVRAAADPPVWRSVRGFVLDLASGRLSEVEAPTRHQPSS
jgi:carbonic anhydrase